MAFGDRFPRLKCAPRVALWLPSLGRPVKAWTDATHLREVLGELGILFFWVGMSVDLGGLINSPGLAILLYLAGSIGKLAGVFVFVPMGRLAAREACTIGVGLDARLTTEIIVAKLLLDAGLIDQPLFTALVSAASVTALTVPFGLSILLRQWGDFLRLPVTNGTAESTQ